MSEILTNVVYPIVVILVSGLIISSIGLFYRKLNKIENNLKCLGDAVFSVCKFSDLRDEKNGLNNDGITRVSLFSNSFKGWIDKK